MADSNVTVEFTDNSARIIGAMNSAIEAFLEEIGGEIESQAKRNTRVGKVAGGQLKGSWTHKVDSSDKSVVVGSPLERSIWYELGTGEYALNGDGRKGGWYIPIGNGKGQMSEEVAKAYNFPIKYGKNGMKFAKTYGMRPQRPLYNAFTTTKPKIKKALVEKIKSNVDGVT